MGTWIQNIQKEGSVLLVSSPGLLVSEWSEKNSKCFSVQKLKALEDIFYSEWIRI